MAVLDAAECPPTFGTPKDMVQAFDAGGAKAFTQADEGTEDDSEKAAADLKTKKLSGKDIVFGIAASGTTPYTLAGLQFAKKQRRENGGGRMCGQQPDVEEPPT